MNHFFQLSHYASYHYIDNCNTNSYHNDVQSMWLLKTLEAQKFPGGINTV